MSVPLIKSFLKVVIHILKHSGESYKLQINIIIHKNQRSLKKRNYIEILDEEKGNFHVCPYDLDPKEVPNNEDLY